jgi:hypothetical protein
VAAHGPGADAGVARRRRADELVERRVVGTGQGQEQLQGCRRRGEQPLTIFKGLGFGDVAVAGSRVTGDLGLSVRTRRNAVSARDIWAVGQTDATIPAVVILHWNGTTSQRTAA